ncbi:MAG TPA: hypothetical protein DDZ51_07265 [Planctomycetaceae bacterium]|nr:hypothetical protein [Planctomycetaceae bacterium]
MSIKPASIVIILQTVRLPHGTEQYVVPCGCRLSRTDLQKLLDKDCVDASQMVVQPGTGREGIERIVALRSEALSPGDRDRLRNHLHQRLADTDSIIEEVAKAEMVIPGQLPTSERLADWQAIAETVIVNPPMANSPAIPLHPPKSWQGKLIAMSLVALLAITAFVTIPPFLSRTKPDEADVARQPAGAAFEGWNVTQSETFSDASDLLEALRPLVVRPVTDGIQTSSDEVELAALLNRINQIREGQPIETVDVKPKLTQLLDSVLLKTYVKKLYTVDGEYDRFGLVHDAPHVDSLKTLLPDTVDESTATTFRTLALQLIGVSAINETGTKLDKFENHFFDRADQQAYRRSYEAMIENIPPVFRNADPRCTFFTVDDCEAAKHIRVYFEDIQFLTGRKLGFKPSGPLSDRVIAFAESKNAASHHFARLLVEWQAFKHGQSPANQNAVKPETINNQ